jgi:ATP-dependent DNA helicase RecG
MLTREQIDNLCKEPESARLEKTISTTNLDKFAEAICAFANDFDNSELNGYLFIGVDDKGQRVGLQISEQLQQQILDFRNGINFNFQISLSTYIESFEDGSVLVVEVRPSPLTPIRYKGVIYIRVGPRKEKAHEMEERILIEKRTNKARTFDALASNGTSITDLNISIFKETYLPLAIDADTLAANNREISLQLASLKFFDLQFQLPTHAGLLLFGNEPIIFFSGAFIQYVKFDGYDQTSVFKLEKQFKGNLYQQLNQFKEFANYIIIKEFLPEIGTEYVRNYPISALLELVYNAVIHRDYQSNAPIRIFEFIDRIEIINAGALYGAANADNFPLVTDYRNPILAEAIKTLGFINRFGIGVQRAKDLLAKNGNPEPVFQTRTPNQFSVTIFRNKKFD